MIGTVQTILIVIIGFGAGFVQRVSGFGLGIFAMLFMPYFMPAHTAATISCLFSCGTSSYNAVKYRKHIPFKTILPLICAAIITIPGAVHFSVVVPQKLFRSILGVVLICLSIYFLAFDKRVTLKPTLKNSLIAGGIGGTINGLFSTGGPPIVLYLSHAIDDKIIYFAAIQCYFALTNIYATIIRIINGVLSWEVLMLSLIGFSGCMVGNFVGTKVFDKLDAKKLKVIIYIGMIISGIIMIVSR